MANIKTPAVTALDAEKGAVIDKIDYRANTQVIPFWIDNGVSLINNADTITFTGTLPPDCIALGAYIKTAGVGNSSALQFKIGSTAVSAAIVISGAIDKFYYFSVAGETTQSAADSVITGLVSAGDWDDGANDVWGYILIATNQ